MTVTIRDISWRMPIEFRRMILAWPKSCKSPHSKYGDNPQSSQSFYSVAAGEKLWGHTPIGTLRISDHWNFKVRPPRDPVTRERIFDNEDKIHCLTNIPVKNSWWTLAQWDGEHYIVLKTMKPAKLWEIPDEDAVYMPPDLKERRDFIIFHRQSEEALNE